MVSKSHFLARRLHLYAFEVIRIAGPNREDEQRNRGNFPSSRQNSKSLNSNTGNTAINRWTGKTAHLFYFARIIMKHCGVLMQSEPVLKNLARNAIF